MFDFPNRRGGADGFAITPSAENQLFLAEESQGSEQGPPS